MPAPPIQNSSRPPPRSLRPPPSSCAPIHEKPKPHQPAAAPPCSRRPSSSPAVTGGAPRPRLFLLFHSPSPISLPSPRAPLSLCQQDLHVGTTPWSELGLEAPSPPSAAAAAAPRPCLPVAGNPRSALAASSVRDQPPLLRLKPCPRRTLRAPSHLDAGASPRPDSDRPNPPCFARSCARKASASSVARLPLTALASCVGCQPRQAQRAPPLPTKSSASPALGPWPDSCFFSRSDLLIIQRCADLRKSPACSCI
ncbi:proline-rich receptor-like protein kinase PERK10 [Triticum aestivum]|uniref:proline-rich receptor-like protein kinase PERK10 n=1 Tax=Triticum aestivum TaxID=4565 RepID=UPI001D016E1E|nr:proline-rich receptor-like protein kinase PERK10 [Triticum aestivum]